MEVFFAHSKIEKFIFALDESVVAEVIRMIALLEKGGHSLREPESKSLGGGLFELRVIDHVHVRIIYMFLKDDSAMMLHAFVKKTGAIPKADMAYARRMQKEWKRLA